MKRLIIALLAGILLITSLAGCTKKDAPTATPPGSENQTAVVQKQDKPGSSLTDVYNIARTNKGASYDMKITMTSPQGGSMTTTSKVWISGNKYRSEMDTMGVKTIVIADGKGDVYMYNPSTNSAMKISAVQASKDKPAGLWAEADVAKFKVLGEETINSQPCLIVSNSDVQGDNKTWINTEIGMPVKSEIKTGDATVAAEFTNIKIGSQPDDLFTLPSGVKIQEMAPKN